MKQYRIIGEIDYLKHCPRAPGVTNPCPSPSACPGHRYSASVDLYVEAPDEERASLVALTRVKSAYPWPLWLPGCQIEEIEQATDRPDPATAPLPGWASILGRKEPTDEP